MDFSKQIELLTTLADSLKKTKDLGEKQEILLQTPQVAKVIAEGSLKPFLPHEYDLSAKIALYSIIAIDQHSILFACPKEPSKDKVRALLSLLVSIDRFYESIGGIVGYHLKVLRLLETNPKTEKKHPVTFSRAEGIDLSSKSADLHQIVLDGILALKELGEIYPIGGLGSRLDLKSKNLEPLPAACLPFCGRTLLEGLIRDVQAKEFLYYRLFNSQVTVPVAMMTSLEKHNAARVRAICEKKKWFDRPKESFFLFSQLSVPVITQEGNWSMKRPLELNLQPGGHGALWKAAEERGVFLWFQSQEKKHLLIRQINNPIAGLDLGLIAFMGKGKTSHKAFGFASCERLPHAAEGVLVLVEKEGKKQLSNIEYTDFKQHGIIDRPAKGGYSPYPANTNILYANLERILPIIRKNPLPGLMLNMKNTVPFRCSLGTQKELIGGRLESMMQNISDAIISEPNQPLSTFLTYNTRQKTISTAKRKFEAGKKLLETPEGAFYDLLANAHDLLEKECKGHLPPFSSEREYLERGPSLIFLYHPALGPLYSLIRQKIQNISLAHNSELQLEIADVYLNYLNLKGSLLITAKNTLGHFSQGIIRYSHQTGKCVLKNVTVMNKGINRKTTKNYWKNQLKRHQALKIILKGHSEFYAENITFKGDQTLVVPDGERWIASQDKKGKITYRVERPNWQWDYTEKEKEIKLNDRDSIFRITS